MTPFPTLSMWPKPANQNHRVQPAVDVDPSVLSFRRRAVWVDAHIPDDELVATSRRKPSRSSGARAAKLSLLPDLTGLRAWLETKTTGGAWALVNSPDEAVLVTELIGDNGNLPIGKRPLAANVDRKQDDNSIVPRELDLRRCIGRPLFFLPEDVLRQPEGMKTVCLEREYDRRVLREALRVAAAEGCPWFQVDGLRFAYGSAERAKSNLGVPVIAVRANELLEFRRGKGWASPKIDYGAPRSLGKKTLEQPSVSRFAQALLQGAKRPAQPAWTRLPKAVCPAPEGWEVGPVLSELGVDGTVPFDRARENAGLDPVMRDMRPALPYGPDKARDLFMAGFVATTTASPLLDGDPPQLAVLLRQEREAALDGLSAEDREALVDLPKARRIADMAPKGSDGSERTLRRLGIVRTAKAMAAANEILRGAP